MHLQQLPDVGSRLQCIIRLTNERAVLKWHTPLTEQSFNDNNNYKSRTCMFAMKDNRSIRWKKLRWKMTGFSWRIVISTSTERKNHARHSSHRNSWRITRKITFCLSITLFDCADTFFVFSQFSLSLSLSRCRWQPIKINLSTHSFARAYFRSTIFLLFRLQ